MLTMENIIHLYCEDTACIVKKDNGEIILCYPEPILFGDSEFVALPSKISVTFPNSDYCCIVNSSGDLLFDHKLEVKSETFFPSPSETVISFTIVKHSSEGVVLPRYTPLASLTFVPHLNNSVAIHTTKSDFVVDLDADRSPDECDCGRFGKQSQV